MKWNHFLQWLINGREKMKKDVIYEQLMGELEPKGIRLINFNKLSAEEGQLLETKGGKARTAIIPCSNNVFKRLIDIPTRKGTFMLSEELILHFLPKMFKNYIVKEKSRLSFRSAAGYVLRGCHPELSERDRTGETLLSEADTENV